MFTTIEPDFIFLMWHEIAKHDMFNHIHEILFEMTYLCYIGILG